MAGNIQAVDVSKLKRLCDSYYSKSYHLRAVDLQGFRNDILDLKKYWTGKRMNSIISTYNEVCDEMQRASNYFCNTVIEALDEIYSQYNIMENSGTARNYSFKYSRSTISSKISLTNTTSVKFSKANVESIQRSMNSRLVKVNNTIPELLSIVKQVAGYSDSLAVLANNFNKNYSSLMSSLKRIQSKMNTAVASAVNAVNVTESYNASDASRTK